MSGLLEPEDIRRLKAVETVSFSGPIPTQVVSSDEYFPEPQTKQQRQVETKLKALGNELAPQARHQPPGVFHHRGGYGRCSSGDELANLTLPIGWSQLQKTKG